jgi:hypothetical protein
MQKVRRNPEGPRPLVSIRFQLSFTPLKRVVFIVQSPYWFAIGRPGVLSLGEWTPHVRSGFHEPESTRGHPPLAGTGLSPSLAAHSNAFSRMTDSSAFARRYLRSRYCFPFLRVLRCFSSPRSLHDAYTFSAGYPDGWVSPFGDLGVNA